MNHFTRRAMLRFLLLLCPCAALSAAPASRPATAPAAADPKLWAKLTEIDARVGRITSLSADFEQRKFTALLRKPLVSAGRVRVKGATMRWDTERPERSVLAVGEKDVRIYYPAQATVEVYALDQRLAELAASPLPRIAVLRERFTITEIPVRDIDDAADAATHVALRLVPTDAALREHLEQVRVLLDASAGYMIAAEMTDPDGDKTLVRLRNVRVNGDVGSLDLELPAGTRVTRPLEGLPTKR